MTINRYSRYTYYMIAAFVVFLALLWTSAAVQAQDETPVPTVVDEPTAEPTAEPTVEPTPETPAPSPEEITSAGIGFGAALIIAFLTGGVSFGGIVWWARSDPNRLKQLEIVGDSIPARIAEPLIEFGRGAVVVMGKVTEGIQLLIEALDRIPHASKPTQPLTETQKADLRAAKETLLAELDTLSGNDLTSPDKPVGPVG